MKRYPVATFIGYCITHFLFAVFYLSTCGELNIINERGKTFAIERHRSIDLHFIRQLFMSVIIDAFDNIF